jgi:hypothetical protein
MNKVDPFFTLILVLLSALIVTYKAAQYDLSGLKFQMLVNQQLKHQIKVLELKQKEFELTLRQPEQKRNLSSVAEVTKVEAPKFELDPVLMAKSMFVEAQKKCTDSKKNVQCLEQVESVISQFPGSEWAGETLVLLTQFYVKNRKIEEAKELVKIVQLEFNKFPKVQNKLNELEKNSL